MKLFLTAARWVVLFVLAAPGAQAADSVEVLHWWTSGGEAQSIAELRARLDKAGIAWKDSAVTGGGGDAALALLKERVRAGEPPSAALMNSAQIQSWGRSKVLASLEAVARAQQWDIQIPRAVSAGLKVDGQYVAVPFNIHRTNWLWINQDLLRRFGGRTPETWEQFFALAERMKRGGVLPIAHGGQAWQELALFETVVLGVGGPEFYRKALLELDPSALRSARMDESLATLRRIRSYTDGAGAKGRDWNVATAMVIGGKAGMQFMGDWAKGEFFAAGKTPTVDFTCASAPGTGRAFIFVVDALAMFKQRQDVATRGQTELAKVVMNGDFQQAFNLKKGSVPLATGARMSEFDLCGQESSAYFAASSMINSLVPSVAFHMSQPLEVEARLKAIVAEFWNDDAMSPTEATRRLVAVAVERRAVRH